MPNGIINVYKEAGYTSFDVVARLRGILHFRKIGHTGTLDPEATGVLPVCVGKATRVVDLLTDKDKEYRADLLLGVSTDTQDTTGEVLARREVSCSEDHVTDTIHGFIGPQQQVPPMYSALKVNGKKLYELAREGKTVERKPRDITIFDIEIEKIELPHVIMRVHCSKGTYIRTLCNDIGEALGCGGCMASLQRTRVSTFAIEDALTLSEIEDMVKADRLDEILMPIDSVFGNLPSVTLDAIWNVPAVNGVKIPVTEEMKKILGKSKSARVYLCDGSFLGIYRYKNKTLAVEKMFYEKKD